ncbi:hypothetical protein O3P69_015667 [Scylla paramamosain]|uniref:Uncharacterized protein n=1 Tax=Scylla paramamosain TaxID=85552 RepID=A0AAW0SJC7_SCYPA
MYPQLEHVADQDRDFPRGFKLSHRALLPPLRLVMEGKTHPSWTRLSEEFLVEASGAISASGTTRMNLSGKSWGYYMGHSYPPRRPPAQFSNRPHPPRTPPPLSASRTETRTQGHPSLSLSARTHEHTHTRILHHLDEGAQLCV